VKKGVSYTLGKITETIDVMLAAHGIETKALQGIGISCGSPLDSRRGVILSPPNLIGWDNVHITQMLEDRYGVPTRLQNDANACALAEWQYGAGKGCDNVVFLTFGTGMGAGLILNGRLYCGASDMAGEVGHMRMARFGPVGYGKAGSFEGFCSGGGIAQLARSLVLERLQTGGALPDWCAGLDSLEDISMKLLAEAAAVGEPVALETIKISSHYLGRGLSVLIDVLNPQVIVIGSIYARCKELFFEEMSKVVEQETLPHTRNACAIVPALLGDEIGDYAALSVALVS
jgi:glucokinase